VDGVVSLFDKAFFFVPVFQYHVHHACIEDPLVIKKILTHLNERVDSAQAMQWPESRVPPQVDLFD